MMTPTLATTGRTAALMSLLVTSHLMPAAMACPPRRAAPHYTQPAYVYPAMPAVAVTTAVPQQAFDPVLQAREAMLLHQFSSAVKFADMALARQPNDSELLQFKALALFMHDDFQPAARNAYSALVLGPTFTRDTVKVLLNSDAAYLHQVARLDQLAKAAPETAHLHFLLGYQHLVLGNAAEARAAFSAAQAKLPNDPVIAQLLALLPASSPANVAATP